MLLDLSDNGAFGYEEALAATTEASALLANATVRPARPRDIGGRSRAQRDAAMAGGARSPPNARSRSRYSSAILPPRPSRASGSPALWPRSDARRKARQRRNGRWSSRDAPATDRPSASSSRSRRGSTRVGATPSARRRHPRRGGCPDRRPPDPGGGVEIVRAWNHFQIGDWATTTRSSPSTSAWEPRRRAVPPALGTRQRARGST